MTEQPFRPLAEAIGASAVDRIEHVALPAGTRCRVVNRNGGADEIELAEPIAGERRWFVATGSLRFRPKYDIETTPQGFVVVDSGTRERVAGPFAIGPDAILARAELEGQG